MGHESTPREPRFSWRHIVDNDYNENMPVNSKQIVSWWCCECWRMGDNTINMYSPSKFNLSNLASTPQTHWDFPMKITNNVHVTNLLLVSLVLSHAFHRVYFSLPHRISSLGFSNATLSRIFSSFFSHYFSASFVGSFSFLYPDRSVRVSQVLLWWISMTEKPSKPDLNSKLQVNIYFTKHPCHQPKLSSFQWVTWYPCKCRSKKPRSQTWLPHLLIVPQNLDAIKEEFDKFDYPKIRILNSKISSWKTFVTISPSVVSLITN